MQRNICFVRRNICFKYLFLFSYLYTYIYVFYFILYICLCIYMCECIFLGMYITLSILLSVPLYISLCILIYSIYIWMYVPILYILSHTSWYPYIDNLIKYISLYIFFETYISLNCLKLSPNLREVITQQWTENDSFPHQQCISPECSEGRRSCACACQSWVSEMCRDIASFSPFAFSMCVHSLRLCLRPCGGPLRVISDT